MDQEMKSKGWWSTVPGVLTAIAGIITAITGLIIALYQVGIFIQERPISPPALAVKSIEILPSSVQVRAGDMVPLRVNLRDKNGNPLSGRIVEWWTNDPQIAFVSPSGVVTGVSPGSEIITALSEGVRATASLTVTSVPSPPSPIPPSRPSRVTKELPFLKEESGWVTAKKRIGTGKAPQAGDFNNNEHVRGFMSFDLSVIPVNAKFYLAKLILPEGAGAQGDVFPTFGSLKFEAVWYGLSLVPEAFDMPSYMVLQDAYGNPNKKIGVSGAIEKALREGYRRFNVRFGFTRSTDNDNDGEIYWVPTHTKKGIPKLEVTYSLPLN